MKTASKEIVSCNILKVTVGSTGLMGGDSGHGGRTFFELKDEGGTDMQCISDEGIIRIELGGDSELHTFIEALEFAVWNLKSIARNPSKESWS